MPITWTTPPRSVTTCPGRPSEGRARSNQAARSVTLPCDGGARHDGVRTEATPIRGRNISPLRQKRLGTTGHFLGILAKLRRSERLETCRAVVRRAFDRGVTHFDLANMYGPPYGSAE